MSGACGSSGFASAGPRDHAAGFRIFWSNYGVTLGGEVTITASVRLQNSKAPAESLIGTLSIGEYVVPPFDTSALPSGRRTLRRSTESSRRAIIRAR